MDILGFLPWLYLKLIKLVLKESRCLSFTCLTGDGLPFLAANTTELTIVWCGLVF